MRDTRKVFENLPEKGNRYDERRHDMMKLKPMFQYEFISLPTVPNHDSCFCGKRTAVVINGTHYCNNCLALRVKDHANS